MHRVLVYRRKFLPKSETFIYEQLIGHRQVKTMVLTRQRPFNRKQFPYSPVYVRKRMTGLSTWLRRKKNKMLARPFWAGWLGNAALCEKNEAALDYVLPRV